jgi:hypothetical protein
MKTFPKKDIKALKAMAKRLKTKIAESRRKERSQKNNPFQSHTFFVTTDPGFNKGERCR